MTSRQPQLIHVILSFLLQLCVHYHDSGQDCMFCRWHLCLWFYRFAVMKPPWTAVTGRGQQKHLRLVAWMEVASYSHTSPISSEWKLFSVWNVPHGHRFKYQHGSARSKLNNSHNNDLRASLRPPTPGPVGSNPDDRTELEAQCRSTGKHLDEM